MSESKNIIYLWFPRKNYGVGGMYAHVKGIISGFISNGYTVTLITCSENVPLTDEKLKVEYIENFSKLPYPFNMRAYTKKITPFVLSKIKEINPEFVYHRYELYIDIFEKIYLGHNKLLLEYNGSYVWVIKYWSPNIIKKIVGLLLLGKVKTFEEKQLQAASNIVVVSEPLRKHLIYDYKIPNEKILFVTNGYDPKIFFSMKKDKKLVDKYNLCDKKVIGFSGTFGPWHGTDIFAKAIKEVVQKRTDVYFLFIGDGLFKNDCIDIINQDNVSEYVTFTGKIPFSEMNDYLNLCDVFVNPTIENKDGSEFFGSPTKLFEYIGTDKTIITSNVGQMGRLFTSDDVYFINSGDYFDLSEKILLALDNPKTVKNKENYTWKEIVKNIIEYNK